MRRLPFGPKPVRVKCPGCHAEVVTVIKREPSKFTHVFALLLCVFGLWCFAWIPYCKATCQNANHYCPLCKAYIGTFKND